MWYKYYSQNANLQEKYSHNATIFIDRLKERYSLGTDAALCQMLGITPNTLSTWKKRNSFDYELVFSKCEDLDANFLLYGSDEQSHNANIVDVTKKGLPMIPESAIAGTGAGELTIHENDIEDRYFIPEFAKADFLIRVKGSSMYPKYNPGDIVACKRMTKSAFIQWNKAYVLDTSQGIMIKRIIKSDTPGRWVLRSDNKDYQDIDIDPAKDVASISLVIGVIRLE